MAEARTTASSPRVGEHVVIVQDAFTTFYEPELVLTVRELLTRLGCTVEIAPYVANGKGLHVKGFLRRFTAQARRNVDALRAFRDAGATLVAIEPAVALTYRDEYRHALGDEHAVDVELLQELLLRLLPKGERGPGASAERFRLFGHCTEKTIAPASQKQWVEAFARLGLVLEPIATGCCGMSGAFGHERLHREESRGIWEMSWARWLGDASDVVVTGYSCRSQAHRFADLSLRHPAEVLLERLAAHERETAEVADPRAHHRIHASAL
jgi:Fe-S oxidoreductase